MRIRAALLFLVLAVVSGATSLPSTPVFGDRLLSFRDGLPGDQVVGIGEDHLGYVWLGTTSGLARLAEPDVEIFGTADGLPSRTVYRIAEDADERLWVGTLKGLAFFDGRRFRSDAETASLQGRVRDLERGPDGSLWALGTPGGVWRRKGRHWTRVAANLPPDAVHLAVDASGTVWLGGAASGLLRLVPAGDSTSRWETVASTKVLGLASVRGGVVAAVPEGLRFFDEKGERRATFDFPPLSDTAIACALSPDGVIYLGTSLGILRFDGKSGRFEHLRSRRGAADLGSLVLRVTRDGNLWAGSVASGAALIFTGLPIAFMNTAAGVPGTQIYSLEFLSAGEALVIQEQGLSFVKFTQDGSVTSSREICSGSGQGCPGSPAAMASAGPGTWIVGGSDGIRRLRRAADGFRCENSASFDPVKSLLVIDIARASDGTFWLATPRGPWRMRPGGSPELVPLRDPNPGVRSVAISRGGRVWIITQAGRIWSLPPERRDFSEVLPAPGNSTVENLFLPADHLVWITRSDGSCEAFDPESARSVEIVAADSVLPGLSPASFVDLGSGRFLAAHRGGVSTVRLLPLSVESRVFSPADLGDPDLEMSGSTRDPSGAVWLTSLGSFVRFAYSDFRPKPSAPLSIERVIDLRSGAGGLRQNRDGSYSVAPRPNAMEVDLACPDHVGPREVRFRTRLIGEDSAWGPWSPDRRVRLVNLAAGSYRFEAQALDRFGRLNPTIASVPFEVRARFRETWLFRASLVAGLALIVAGAVRWRISRLVARQAELEAVVEDRTKELAKANALLAESSLTDPLTGLRNRRYLADVFAREIANQTREARRRRAAGEPAAGAFYFLLIDLDHFKDVNDRFGHAAGDAVLQQFASILGEETRKGDILVRWGGEEFLAVSRQTSPDGERALAERIRSAVALHDFVIGAGPGETLRITCSAGFVAYPVEGISDERLTWSDAIALADHALYQAKQKGRNRWVELIVRGDVLMIADGIERDAFDVLLRDPAQALRRGWIETKSPGED